jgi:SAM-dependent methyltransferase
MPGFEQLAPGVPDDYYRHIHAVERDHFWYLGMWRISSALLGSHLTRGGSLLDAGCGTGGFLRLALDAGHFDAVAGVDVAGAAVALARERVPEADIRVAALRELPFADDSFDLVVSNDVLQHVPEGDVAASLGELRRVLADRGTLLVRTNGSRTLRREREDWRAYDRASLRTQLENAGFAVERLTHANMVLSALGAALGRAPHAPSEQHHGIPRAAPGRLVSVLGRGLLSAEARWLARGRSLPYGYTLFALARRR